MEPNQLQQSHNIIMGVMLAAILVGMYFLPTIIAYRRGHHNRGSIFAVNFAFGWTFIGWFIALAMASSGIRSDVR